MHVDYLAGGSIKQTIHGVYNGRKLNEMSLV
ncbi:hypothetical protein S1OALGB6SA_1822 [Olavius algarvensis spirochete endosymbiont]|nr:hypothetical protein S1OALGB6SA_1822 [Olavius algarvensis spirochete endosymbiont]